jgi:hypothetical protein
MNLPTVHNGETGGNAGAVAFGGPQAAPAQFTVGQVGFGPAWSDEPSLRQDCELSEANARIAVLEQERAIFKATIESLRDQLCADKCRDKASADGGWSNI